MGDINRLHLCKTGLARNRTALLSHCWRANTTPPTTAVSPSHPDTAAKPQPRTPAQAPSQTHAGRATPGDNLAAAATERLIADVACPGMLAHRDCKNLQRLVCMSQYASYILPKTTKTQGGGGERQDLRPCCGRPLPVRRRPTGVD
jgi:hypothetical protein